MSITLYIANGAFPLDPKYSAEELALELDSNEKPAVLELDLRGGERLRLHVTHKTDWAMLDDAI